ncbi:MAG: ADP-glyceromanno-heptose 6-epimerase [Verrucomicrobiota bacterium]|nr:ADP-glyceromanno-heptose 6-epimerase [Verrucomicrobiota bacterium]
MNGLLMITGAAGMIGSGVVRHLNDLGRKNLLLVDDLKRGEKWKNLVQKSFVEIISKGELFEWLQVRGDEVEGILHLGACSDTTERDADYLLENNVRFSIRLAEWALGNNKRFVYASSAATYGDGSRGFIDDEALLQELSPLNMYGFSKHLVDLWMHREGGLKRAAALKYFNIFGPNEYHKGHMRSMPLKMTELAVREGSVDLFQSNDLKQFAHGDQQRDFLYVKDAVRMTLALFDSALGGVYNIGRGEAATWNSLAHALFAALERPARIRYIEMPTALSGQYQNYTCADMTKIGRAFPQFSYTSLQEAVRDYVQNYILPGKRW